MNREHVEGSGATTDEPDRSASSHGKAPRADRPTEALESVERQLRVLEVFDAEHPKLTLSDVATLTDTTRPTARRILLTLKSLGYIRLDGREYSLTPKVLNFGWSYFASRSLEEAVQPVLNDLRSEIEESCSVGELDGPDIVYIARAYTRRVTTLRGRVGARQPAHATAVGQAILAHLDPEKLDDWLTRHPLTEQTPRTITDEATLRKELAQVCARGWSLVDGDLEPGLRAIGAPVTGPGGRVVAGLSISTIATRTMISDLHSHANELQRAADLLSSAFKMSYD